MKKNFVRILAIIMSLVMVFGTLQVTFAQEMTQNGIKLSITTDKESYTAGEKVKVTVKVTNTTGSAVDNIKVELDIPDGVTLAEGTETSIDFGTINAGSENTQVVELTAGTAVDAGGTSGNVETGDNGRIAVFIILAIIAIIVFVLAAKKKTKAAGTIASITIAVIGTALTIQTAFAAYSFGSFGASTTFKYDGKDKTITAEIKYGEPVATVELSDSYSRVAVHDPSIVKDPETGIYYVFGSHMAWAKSTDLINWTTFTNNINTDYATIFSVGKAWSEKGSSTYDISGNLWAPDVIWNEEMGKWCMYMSVNGDKWYTSIAMLTADSLEGNWTYAGTVVYSGFTNATEAALTDYAQVIGSNEVASRYLENRNGNHTYGLNAIDPCVIYDEEGNLWMSYGSWFGGMYMLKLDETTGLRDYDYTYQTTADVSDAYQGIKIAGGNHVSGEASYIQEIDGTYYLFVSYGGLVANGGYNMRVFSSDNITGPYTDTNGSDARYLANNTSAGNINGTVGTKLMGYYKWSYMKYAQVAQGHNSAFVDADGKAYVVYHTRTNDGTEGHMVKVHQLFVNANGGLVAAPYEYTGETLSETAIASSDVVGKYEIILHRQSINYSSLEYVAGEEIELKSDGTISGAYTGTWTQATDSPEVTLVMNNQTYSGYFIEQVMEGTQYSTLCFTALGTDEVELWGSKYLSGKQAVDLTIASGNVTVPTAAITDITFETEGLYGTTVSYKSSNTDVITNDGIVTRAVATTNVTITATYTNGSYSDVKEYTVRVLGVGSPDVPILLAEYYTDSPLDISNAVEGTYQVPNPFNSSVTTGLEIYNGVSIEFDVEGTGTIFSSILAFYGAGRMYFTGGSYLGYNANDHFFDANIDNADWKAGTQYIDGNTHFKLDLDNTGFKLYANGILAYETADYESDLLGGQSMGSYSEVLTWLNNSAETLNFGWGSWWTDKFNGTISNVKLYSNYVPIDTEEHLYYKNYSNGITTDWVSASASGDLTTGNDGNEYGNYMKFAANTATSGNRSAYTLINAEEPFEDDYVLTFRTALTAGIISNRSNSGLVVMNSNATAKECSANSIVVSNYILKLNNTPPAAATNSNDSSLQNRWYINDTEDYFEATPGSWINVSVSVKRYTDYNKVIIVITDDSSEELYSTTINADKSTTTLKGIQLLRGRGIGTMSIDSIIVDEMQQD